MKAVGGLDRLTSLIVAVGSKLCALPLAYVVETMRPLPIALVREVHRSVLGLAVVRGVPVPVVDLASAIGDSEKSSVTRFVSVRLGDRGAALAVDAVVGIRALEAATLDDAPPLLGSSADAIDAIGTLDSKLLVVLRATRILSEQTWRALDARGSVR